MPDSCRCGFAGEGEHPCHGFGYTCGKPAKRRIYHQPGPISYSLAGVQMKLAVDATWACDGCWEKFSDTLRRANDVASA